MADKKKASEDFGQAEVTEKVNEEQEQGFRGVKVDPTPNEAYTVEGVSKGMPTPETDARAADKAEARAEHIREDVVGEP